MTSKIAKKKLHQTSKVMWNINLRPCPKYGRIGQGGKSNQWEDTTRKQQDV